MVIDSDIRFTAMCCGTCFHAVALCSAALMVTDKAQWPLLCFAPQQPNERMHTLTPCQETAA